MKSEQPENLPNQPQTNVDPSGLAPKQNTSPTPQPHPIPSPVVNNPQPAESVANAGNPMETFQSKAPGDEPSPAPVGESSSAKKSSKKRLIVPIIAGAILLLGGAGAAYNQMVVNSPENIWKNSLAVTAGGLNELADSILTQENQAKGLKLEGNFKVSEPVVVDGSMSGKTYEQDGEYSGNVGFSGVRLTGDVKTIAASGSAYPDIYFKADGLESISGLLGFTGGDPQLQGLIEQYNDSWFVVDHTLFEEIANQALQDVDTSISPDETMASINEFYEASIAAAKDYLFSTGNNAVFTLNESVGKEEFDGVDTYRYKVGVNKENLKKFIAAYIDAVKDTEYITTTLKQSGQSLEDALNVDQLYEEIDKANQEKLVADVWIDANTKLIRNIRFNMDDEVQPNYLDVGLKYDGGDNVELSLNAVFTEENEFSPSSGTLSFTTGYNVENKGLSMTFDLNIDENGQNIVANGSIMIEPSDEQIIVEVPEGATNVLELLNGFSPNALMPTTPNYDDSIYDDRYYDQLYESYYLGPLDSTQEVEL